MNLSGTQSLAKKAIIKSTYGVENFSDQEYNRPRRPNPDTVQYLSSLPLDLRAAEEELNASVLAQDSNQGYDEPQMIAAAKAAIEEVQHEIASLAGEEHSSAQLELLVKIACGEHLGNCELSARRMLYGLSGYYLHLACHRYGSHVAQTVIETCGRFQDKGSINKHEGNDEHSDTTLPSVQDLILAAALELVPHARSLARHVCGSHVIRAVLCALAGVAHTSEVIKTHGTNSCPDKKKKKKPHDGSNSNCRHAQNMNIEYPMTKEGTKGLESLIEAITGYTMKKYFSEEGTSENNHSVDSEMLALLCHPSSGPLIDLLVRVLATLSSSSSAIKESKQKYSLSDNIPIDAMATRFLPNSEAEMFIKYILHWHNPKKCGDIIYGLSGETYGSRILETIFQVTHDDMYQELLDRAKFLEKLPLIDYVHHNVSNFVVQTILQTLRSNKQGEALFEGLVPLVRNGELLQPSRRGVALHLVEMCARWNIGQDDFLDALLEGCSKHNNEDQTKKVPLKIQSCINHLLSIDFPEGRGGKLKIDFNGTRIIHNLLRFAPHRCSGVLEGILSLKDYELVAVAKDGLASRW